MECPATVRRHKTMQLTLGRSARRPPGRIAVRADQDRARPNQTLTRLRRRFGRFEESRPHRQAAPSRSGGGKAPSVGRRSDRARDAILARRRSRVSGFSVNTATQNRACGRCRRAHIRARMLRARRIVRYALEALVVLVPLAVLIYFLVYPDKFDASFNWLIRR